MRVAVALTALCLLLAVACNDTPASNPTPKTEPEQDLTITFGGFLQNGPENELLDGQCSTNIARDVLQCDIHNGFMKWNITDITFQVIRTGDAENERHYYRERVSIDSLQTQTVTIKLGMTLPRDTQFVIPGRPTRTASHWSWLIVGAKGLPVK